MALDELNLQIRREIGRGAHSQVFEIDVEAGREPLVIRVEFPPSPVAGDASRQRRRAPAHPNVLPILEQGRLMDGRAWQVMRLVRTIDAHELVARQGPTAALSLLSQALAGLSILHSAGFLHSDIKPENILVESTGESDGWYAARLVLADYETGATAGGGPKAAGLTGSLGYFAPEQILHAAPNSKATDVFALGLWLLWLITGKQPFVGEDPAASLREIATFTGPIPLGRFDTRYSGRFWVDLLGALLDPEPDSRLADGPACLKFLLARSHSVPEFDAHLGELLWNPLTLARWETDILDQVLASDMSVDRPDAFILTDIPNRRIPEAAEYLRTALEGPDRQRPLTGSADSSDHDSSIVGGSTKFLCLNAASSEAIPDIEALQSTLDTWSLRPRLEGPPPFPPVIFASESSLPILRSLAEKGFQLKRVAADAGATGLEFSSGSFRFSGVPVSHTVIVDAHARGITDAIQVEGALQEAFRLGALRVAADGIAVAAESVDAIWRHVEEVRRRHSNALSERASVLFALLSTTVEGIQVKNLESRRAGPWAIAVDELIDAGAARLRDGRERLSLTSQPSTTRTIGLAGPHLTELPSLLEFPPGSRELDLIQLWIRGYDPTLVPRLFESCRALYRTRHFGQALAILRRPPDWPGSEEGVRAELGWTWLLGHTFLAAGDEFRGILALDRVESILSSMSRREQAARMALRIGLRWVGLGRTTEAVAALTRSQLYAQQAGTRRGRRLAERAQVELAFVERAQRPPELLATECQALARDPDSDRLTRACAHRVLAEIEHRAGRMNSYREQAACTIRLVRRSCDPASKARYYQSFASFHFSNGRYRRARRLLKSIEQLPQHRLKSFDRTALISGLGGLAYEEGRYVEALQQNLRLLDASRRERVPIRVTIASLNVALILRDMDRLYAALQLSDQAAGDFDRKAIPQLSDPDLVAVDVLLLLGAADQARKRLEAWKASCWVDARGNRHGAWHLLSAQLEDAAEDPEAARAHFEAAEALFTDMTMRDEVFLTRLYRLMSKCEPASGAERHARLTRLWKDSSSGVGWRSRMRCRLALAETNDTAAWAERVATVDQLCTEITSSGFLALDASANALKVRLLIEGGWSSDARDVLRMALDRVRTAAGEIRDSSLRAAYLADPRRQVFRALSVGL